MKLAAILLWAAHGILLVRTWGRFRPHVALAHGIGVALAGACFTLPPLPLWVPYGAGGVLGLMGAVGHPLVPGMWVGLGLLAALVWALPGMAVHQSAAAFALAAQVVGLVALVWRRNRLP